MDEKNRLSSIKCTKSQKPARLFLLGSSAIAQQRSRDHKREHANHASVITSGGVPGRGPRGSSSSADPICHRRRIAEITMLTGRGSRGSDLTRDADHADSISTDVREMRDLDLHRTRIRGSILYGTRISRTWSFHADHALVYRPALRRDHLSRRASARAAARWVSAPAPKRSRRDLVRGDRLVAPAGALVDARGLQVGLAHNRRGREPRVADRQRELRRALRRRRGWPEGRGRSGSAQSGRAG